jgi:hypothetical protein
VLAVGVTGIVSAELLRAESFGRIEWLAREATRALAVRRR